jgi:hypothetical protein
MLQIDEVIVRIGISGDRVGRSGLAGWIGRRDRLRFDRRRSAEGRVIQDRQKFRDCATEVGSSGSKLTVESRQGFPSMVGCENLRDARRKIGLRVVRRSSSAQSPHPGPQRAAEACLAGRDRAFDRRWCRHERDHAATGTSETCVWRWQERFMEEGFGGLLRDKTRPSRIKPLGAEAAERVVALTLVASRPARQPTGPAP